ncbi:TIGR02611 family protein [Rhodococcoides trifolii]|uniref:TIGR02611 family protein n=1 Tax=Rhodococcoides trifolii TaxID=908250 RepID=UPI001E4934CF|nr:TIGR02611 family protein [Rhodococcus trifolii]
MDDDDNAFEEAAGRYQEFRAKIAEKPTMDLAYRIGVGVLGAIVLVIGILLIPYPGPGWVIVFAGLGILASEFAWAKRLLKFAKKKYNAFMEWFGRQSMFVKALGVLFTAAVVVLTLWLLGAIGLVAGWVGLDQAWLQSPI